MKKFGLSVVTLIMILAFMPYNLEEGPGLTKVNTVAAETFDNQYVQNEKQAMKDTCRQVHKGKLYGSLGGVLVMVLLLYIFL